jgi:predicted transcriptional regulator
MTQRRVNFFERIGKYIRGYKGYATREEKRNTDKKLRDDLAEKIRQSEIVIISHQQQLLKTGEIQRCQDWEIARKALNTVYSQIKNAVYGESSFFSDQQLKEAELDEIYKIDLEISERVSLIFKTIETEINELMSAGFILQQVNEIEKILSKRTNFINQFK